LERKEHVWSYDFVFHKKWDGCQLKMLTLVDEHTRETLGIHVAQSVTSQNVST
jgi:putative transposase